MNNKQRVIGLDLNADRVGASDSHGLAGQFNIAVSGKTKNVGAYLVDLDKALGRILDSARYEAVAIEVAEYGINVADFTIADRRARMIGVVSLAASRRMIELIEVSPGEVSAMATGRKKTSKSDFLKSARANGVDFTSEYVAHAYWVMQVALKKKNR